ncbi:DUF5995 family protein [Pseudonocardia sp. H11422]|uniref:DUF5995 family protein n=1 Tax=Pseudonocardia sp. H11422 TaxID=2835866 RepID=UPI001BDCB605|nr:DUF5995 family protein [Pseudonocardia sp. H11422]
MAAGSTQKLAQLATPDPGSIPEVLDRLGKIRDYAAETSLRGENDGIACFTKLYHIITKNVGDTADAHGFADPDFLIRLDIEFAIRHFRALQAYAKDMDSAPRCWRVLFDHRSDLDVQPVQYAAVGVNAHVNYDLALALIATWEKVPPVDRRRQLKDYRRINDIFAQEMDGLRETFDSLLSSGEDGDLWDRLANRASDLLIRFTRDLAWDEATDIWDAKDRERALARSDRKLDATAEIMALGLLHAPFLPV